MIEAEIPDAFAPKAKKAPAKAKSK
jgi:hypothetical protein